MAIDFPGSPNIGDTFTSGTTTWSWDGGKWVPAPAGNWVEAPADNTMYVRRNAAWTNAIIQGDAPNDGQFYRRTVVSGQMAWVPDPVVNDAPASAGNYYARMNGAWSVLSPTFTLKTYVDSQDTTYNNNVTNLINAIAVPIGAILMYGAPSPPPRFLNCDGTVYNISSVPQLNAVIGNRFGGDGSTTCGVPNLGGRFPVSTTIGAVGGAGSFAIAVGNLPPHLHLVPAHNHGYSDPGHNHGQSGHGHSIADPGHAHNVNLPGSFGYGIGAQAPPNPFINSGGYNRGSDGAGTGIGIYAANANINAAGIGIGIANNGPWGTDPSWNQGSSAAIGLYPPYLGFNFIIRYY